MRAYFDRKKSDSLQHEVWFNITYIYIGFSDQMTKLENQIGHNNFGRDIRRSKLNDFHIETDQF